MKSHLSVKELLEQSEDDLFQRLIDEQEGTLGIAESSRSPAPSGRAMERWERALRGYAAPPRAYLLRRIVAVSILAAAVLVIAAAAFHVEISNFFITVQKVFTEFKTATPEEVIGQWEHVYLPTSVPDGYFVSDAYGNGDMRLIEYANSAGDRITFYQYTSKSGVRIDTENAGETVPCRVGPYEAYTVRKGEVSTLYWFVENGLLSLEYNTPPIESQAALQMAENIKLERE